MSLMIKFTCKSCKKAYKVPEEYSGKRVKCKQCNEVCIVPGGNAVGDHSGDSLQAFNNLIIELGKEESTAPPIEEEESDS